MGYIIRFVDKGQDFLEWELNEIGVVVHSRPFQTSVWRFATVNEPWNLKPGSVVLYQQGGSPDVKYIKYMVKEVATTTPINLSAPVADLEAQFKLSIRNNTQQDFEVALRAEEKNQTRREVMTLLTRCIAAKQKGKDHI